jgi:hypothetical protein
MPNDSSGLGVGVLVSLVADDQVGDRRTGRLVVSHLVDAAFLQPTGGLEHQVVEQVQHEVAAVLPLIVHHLRMDRTGCAHQIAAELGCASTVEVCETVFGTGDASAHFPANSVAGFSQTPGVTKPVPRAAVSS